MPKYVLDHHLAGEKQRLGVMSALLDPMHRRYLERAGAGPRARTLEVGCGNGSVAAWLARRAGPAGLTVAIDIDLSVAEPDVAGLDLREADILSGPVPPADFDLVTARAVLHHVADASKAISNMLASARPGGAILLIEPDFLPASVAEPPEVLAFWNGWLEWSRQQGIDYFLGRRLPAMLAGAGVTDITATAETALYNGSSPWARYWSMTITELRPSLVASGFVSDRLVDAFLAHSADPGWWTQTIAFTAVCGLIPARAARSPLPTG